MLLYRLQPFEAHEIKGEPAIVEDLTESSTPRSLWVHGHGGGRARRDPGVFYYMIFWNILFYFYSFYYRFGP